MNNICKLFNTMTGSQLDPISQDIRFNELTIEIAKGRLALSGEVRIDSYHVAAAEVLVSVDGVSIRGAVTDLDLGEGICV